MDVGRGPKGSEVARVASEPVTLVLSKRILNMLRREAEHIGISLEDLIKVRLSEAAKDIT